MGDCDNNRKERHLNKEQWRAQEHRMPRHAQTPPAQHFGQKPKWQGASAQSVSPARLRSWVDSGFRLPGSELGPERPIPFHDPSPDHVKPPARPPRGDTERDRLFRQFMQVQPVRVVERETTITDQDLVELARAERAEQARLISHGMEVHLPSLRQGDA